MFHLLLIAVLTMAGCYSWGTADIKNQELIAQVQIGKSTKEDVKRIFGDPSSISKGKLAEAMPGHASYNLMMDEWWTYFHMKHEDNMLGAVPYVGVLLQGTKDEYTHLAVGFDAKGIVQHVSSGQSKGKGGILNSLK